jgi:hypothetical protein
MLGGPGSCHGCSTTLASGAQCFPGSRVATKQFCNNADRIEGIAMLTMENSKDFYEKLLAEFDEFMEHQDSARHAMNCAITGFHLHDWVWNDYLKQDATLRATLGIGKKKHEFLKWIINSGSIWFSLVEEIANGSKHFGREIPFRVPLVNDYVEEGYAEPNYFVSYFAIDQGEDVADARYMPLSMLFETMVRFWRDFFTRYSPYKDLPKSKTKLFDEQ